MDYQSQRAFMGVLYDTGGDYAQGGIMHWGIIYGRTKREKTQPTLTVN